MTATIIKLDIGAGAKREEGWTTVDIVDHFKPDILASISRLPFADNTVEEIRCWHVLEHLPPFDFDVDWERRTKTYVVPLIAAMNEMHRVLKPWCEADIEVPVFPYWTAIADPTHVSFFVPQTFDYFCDQVTFGDHMKLYGIKPWKHVSRVRLMDAQIVRVRLAKVPE